MKGRSIIRTLAAVALVVSLSTANTSARWGRRTGTTTTDANAKMDLPEYKGLRHAIGCKDFENKAGWRGRWELSRNLSVMLESALYDTGRFVVVEREKLGTVLHEQDLMASGRMAKAKKAAQKGKIRPARYIGTGAITEITEGQSARDGGIRIKGVRLGLGGGKATMTVIVKLVDTTTSEVVAKQTVKGEAGRLKFRVGASFRGVGGNFGGFEKTPLAEAAQDCINKAAEFIAKKMEEFPFEGSVVKATSTGKVIINRGSNFGVEVGQALVMATEGEVLMDPDTGEILDKEEGEVIGKLVVTKVKEKVSYCKVVEGEQQPATGTVVKAAD